MRVLKKGNSKEISRTESSQKAEARERNREEAKEASESERIRELTVAARHGGIAQLGEHLLCKQGVNGSIPFISTKGLKDLSRNQYGLIAQPVRAHA